MAPSVTTTQRRRMAKSMIPSTMSVLVFCRGFFQLGLQREGVGNRIGFPGLKAAQYLDILVILTAGAHLPCFKAVLVADEQGRRALDGLQRLARHDHL